MQFSFFSNKICPQRRDTISYRRRLLTTQDKARLHTSPSNNPQRDTAPRVLYNRNGSVFHTPPTELHYHGLVDDNAFQQQKMMQTTNINLCAATMITGYMTAQPGTLAKHAVRGDTLRVCHVFLKLFDADKTHGTSKWIMATWLSIYDMLFTGKRSSIHNGYYRGAKPQWRDRFHNASDSFYVSVSTHCWPSICSKVLCISMHRIHAGCEEHVCATPALIEKFV